jgi:hypothetical protein
MHEQQREQLSATEGCAGTRGETLVRTNRCTEAIRLVRVVTAYDGLAPSGGSHGAEILSTATAAGTASG